ncbi:sigma-70 family RNA polymerase sigma factor [Vallitalea pronyensis]|uniref:Sigma-70 family RNA polymerase sigma factor n=1 Tax=Vallitalea pronyensis TaxID=1348613 RepID=A0A8J8SHP9_9FIRM|nr:sigma-70 family RNA polymerase sigma factor [Vallitalea pronyensis]QUI24085.1 sigma-70 family RNA polymerase sigma factor [Vallitalea pronyensis]
MNKQLVKKAQKGNKEALAQLFLSVQDESYKIAYSYLRHEQDSMDAVCTAIEKALMTIKNLKKAKYFRTWFIRIVINEAKMYIRKQSKVIYLQDDVLEVQTNRTSKICELQQKELAMDIKEALDNLPETDRSMVYMKYYLEYSFREIGEIYQMPESTIKTKVYNALEKLRGAMVNPKVI